MKRPIILFCLILSAPIFAQSNKNIEIIKDPNWNREEEQEQVREESIRDMQEKKAEEPAPVVIERPAKQDPRLKGYGIK